MIPITRPWLPPLDEYVALLEEIWDTRMLSNFSDFSMRLERIALGYLGSPHVLAVASGDLGLMVALRALGLPEGATCFVSTFTFNSTINAALWNRLSPVLIDIDPDTFNMSPLSLQDAMERHRGPGVVLATHVFGNPCDHTALEQAARSHGSYLVYDAAHGYGSIDAGHKVGTLGDADVFSLSGTKLVTSAEGGLVSTPHEDIAQRVRYLRAYGFQNDYMSKFVGVNGKLSELHSALATLTLPRVEEMIARRHQIVFRYRENLGNAVGWQLVREGDRSTYKDVALRLGSRSELVENALTRIGVQTKRYFVPLHHMEPYEPAAYGPLPVADEVHSSVLCVPAFNDLSDHSIDEICSVILEVME